MDNFVVLPNLFYGAGRDTKYGLGALEHGSEEHTRMRSVWTKMTVPPVMEDIAHLLEFVLENKETNDGLVGFMGIV